MSKNKLEACRNCPNRLDRLSIAQLKAVREGERKIAFDNNAVYLAEDSKTTIFPLAILASERPDIAKAVDDCNSPSIERTPRTDMIGRSFGLVDKEYFCGAAAVLGASDEAVS